MSNIEFFFEDIESVQLQEEKLIKAIKVLVDKEDKSLGDISVIFCSDNYLLEMNREYLNHDYFTDIITFDYVEDDVISGDLFISWERVADNAQQLNVSFEQELYRVVLHGVLHLVGYKDKSDEEQKIMREKEDYYLSVGLNG